MSNPSLSFKGSTLVVWCLYRLAVSLKCSDSFPNVAHVYQSRSFSLKTKLIIHTLEIEIDITGCIGQ